MCGWMNICITGWFERSQRINGYIDRCVDARWIDEWLDGWNNTRKDESLDWSFDGWMDAGKLWWMDATNVTT